MAGDVSTGEIAVIGMAGRFPGADSIDQLWENLEMGVESISFLDEDELAGVGVDRETMDNPAFVKSPGGLIERMEYFDASFFGYTPMEAEQLAPPIRIFHQCLWEALEDGGYVPDTYPGVIGLYAGSSPTRQWEMLSDFSTRPRELNPVVSGYLNNRDFLATLIAYRLNLRGPAFTLHTACSTSLVAIHFGCRDLRNRECDMVLSGGAGIKLQAPAGYMYQDGFIHSPDGHCRTFDARAQGSCGGDGVGVVLLKRLEDALNDNDHIYAVIAGSAVNNDGSRKVGYAAPGIDGQSAVIRNAHKAAGISAEDIGYVETHGTATPMGDVTEMEALKMAFNTDKKQYCALGAIKSNIGHLDAAAGVAGFIKTVLMLKHRRIPPTIHFEKPNPRIDFENSPFFVNTISRDWEPETPGQLLRAGVSSFGIGGTNAHVVLSEAPAAVSSGTEADEADRLYLLPLSAATPTALDAMTTNLARYLSENPGVSIADAAYTLQVGRKTFPYRRKLVCADREEAVEILNGNDSAKLHTLPSRAKEAGIHTVFVFPGLGAQYSDMALGLYRTRPVFKATADRCFDILETLLDFPLKNILYPDATSVSGSDFSLPSINDTEISQLTVFIVEYSLAMMLLDWGLNPRAMIGYSFGEYAAACVAGVFSTEDVLKLLVLRGKLLREVERGIMLSVPLPADDTQPLLSGRPEISLAIDNGSSCVVSGTVEAVEAFEKEMKNRRLMCMRLDAGHAIHSPMMEPLLERFEAGVSQFRLNPPRIPYISTVTGDWINAADAVSPAYWCRQLRHTVFFARGIQRLLSEGDTVFLETGPGRDVSAMVKRAIDDNPDNHDNQLFKVVPLVRNHSQVKSAGPEDHHSRADSRFLLNKIGVLWMYGVNVDWQRFHGSAKPSRVSLPTYPFEEKRFWQLPDDFQSGRVAISLPGAGKKPASDFSHRFYTPVWKRMNLLNPGIVARSNIVARPGQGEHKVRPYVSSGHSSGRLNDHLNRRGESCIRPARNGRESLSENYDSPENWLLFRDSEGVADALIRQLETFEHLNIITVTPGDSPGYDELFETLLREETFPHRVIHCLTVTPAGGDGMEPDILETCHNTGFTSLFNIVRAISRNGSVDNPVTIDIISGNMCDVTGAENLHPGKASLLSLSRAVSREYSHITVKNIDMELPRRRQGENDGLFPLLLKELLSGDNPPSGTVAYRNNRRWVREFDPLQLEPSDSSPLLRKDGVYLFYGQPGNTGFAAARYLFRQFAARLVFIGGNVEKDARMKQLKKDGAQVLCLNGDINGRTAPENVFKEIESRFESVNGVIYASAAGSGDPGNLSPMESITPDQLRSRFLAERDALLSLDRITACCRPDFCLLLSSAAAVFGDPGYAVYSGADNVLNAFAAFRNRNPNGSETWFAVSFDDTSRENTPDAFSRIFNQPVYDELLFLSGSDDPEDRFKRTVETRTAGESLQTTDESPKVLAGRPELSTDYVPPGNDIERSLAHIWQRFFGLESVGVLDDLIELGGDSLKAINIISIIEKDLHVSIPMKDFFQRSTIRSVAEYIETADSSEFDAVEPSEQCEYYACAPLQRRIYVLHQMMENSTAYNITNAVAIRGKLQKETMERVFQTLVQRHESLRTSFELRDGAPVQIVHPAVDFRIDTPEAGDHDPSELAAAFIRPFELNRAPLMRIAIVEQSPGNYLWLTDMHHIISDGTSQSILVTEFMQLMSGKELPPLRIQYKDFSNGRWAAEEKNNWLHRKPTG